VRQYEIRKKQMKSSEFLSETEKQKGVDGKACWKGYKRMGTKQKGGKTVDNCVKMEGVGDYVGRKLGVKVTQGKPNPKNAPRWATSLGQTPQGAWHWLEKKGPLETPDSDRYFPLSGKTEFTGFVSDYEQQGVEEDHSPEDPNASYNVGEYDREGDMAIGQLETAADAANELRSILDADDNLPEWVQKKIVMAVDYLDTVRDYMKTKEGKHTSPSGVVTNMDPEDDDYEINYGKDGLAGKFIEETYHGDEFYEAYGELWFNEDEQLDEAEYQGRKVSLGKPMQGDVKKFKVYVKNPKGNVVKVNFGDPDMRIKKSNPARRKSFRARHNCANPGPRHKARYWSCRAW